MQSLPFCNQTGDSENQGDSDRFNLQPATNWLLSQLSVVQWRKPASTFSLYSNVSPSCLCFSSIPGSPFLDLSSFLHVLHPLFFFIICHIAASSLLSFLPHLSPSPLLKLISFWSSPLFFNLLWPCLSCSSRIFVSASSFSALSFLSLLSFLQPLFLPLPILYLPCLPAYSSFHSFYELFIIFLTFYLKWMEMHLLSPPPFPTLLFFGLIPFILPLSPLLLLLVSFPPSIRLQIKQPNCTNSLPNLLCHSLEPARPPQALSLFTRAGTWCHLMTQQDWTVHTSS